MAELVDYASVLAAVRRLIAVARAAGDDVREPIVLVGGSAMAAHGIRAQSVDVDVYAPSISPDAAHRAEQELATELGSGFRLDVTAGSNVWGEVILRDIGDSPVVEELEPGLPLRALSIEDLFHLKLITGRHKDLADLPALGAASSADALVSRFGQLAAWHGDRRAILRFADDFVRALTEHLGQQARDVIARIEIPDFVRDALADSWLGQADDPD